MTVFLCPTAYIYTSLQVYVTGSREMICLLEVCALRVRFYLTLMIPREFIRCIWWFKQVIYTQEILKINKP